MSAKAASPSTWIRILERVKRAAAELVLVRRHQLVELARLGPTSQQLDARQLGRGERGHVDDAVVVRVAGFEVPHFCRERARRPCSGQAEVQGTRGGGSR